MRTSAGASGSLGRATRLPLRTFDCVRGPEATCAEDEAAELALFVAGFGSGVASDESL